MPGPSGASNALPGDNATAASSPLSSSGGGTVSFAVASAFELPFDDACFDVVLTAFSPWPAAEFERVLRPGGFVIAAGPGPDHLFGLKVGYRVSHMASRQLLTRPLTICAPVTLCCFT